MVRVTRSRRGFTLSEILIAATLSLVFASLIAQTISVGVRVSTDTTSRVAAETRARELFRTTTSTLRGAIPLGTCMEPQGSDYDNCKVVTTRSLPIVYAGPDKLYFYAYAKGQGASPVTARKAPDLVQLTFDIDSVQPGSGVADGRYGTFSVNRWFPTAGFDYVLPPWPWTDTPCSTECRDGLSTPIGESLRIGVADGRNQPLATFPGCSAQRKVFSYFDANGVELQPTSNCKLDLAELKRISLVVIDANISYSRRGGTDRTFKLSAAVSIPSVSYAQVSS
jgi:prepilin-type N-terminal cleavage/methylation domain-containing protein